MICGRRNLPRAGTQQLNNFHQISTKNSFKQMLFINVKHFNKLKNKITIKNSILKISQFWLFPLLEFFFDSITAVRCK